MKGKLLLCFFLASSLLLLCGCGARQAAASPMPAVTGAPEAEESPVLTEAKAQEENTAEEEEPSVMKMQIGDTPVEVQWEENESVDALRDLVGQESMRISLSMYGGFEQVGSIGQSLPRADAQTTTSAGDIVLYSGNQIVVFYGSNSWAYTRLGRITDKSPEELRELLGSGDTELTLSAP